MVFNKYFNFFTRFFIISFYFIFIILLQKRNLALSCFVLAVPSALMPWLSCLYLYNQPYFGVPFKVQLKRIYLPNYSWIQRYISNVDVFEMIISNLNRCCGLNKFTKPTVGWLFNKLICFILKKNEYCTIFIFDILVGYMCTLVLYALIRFLYLVVTFSISVFFFNIPTLCDITLMLWKFLCFTFEVVTVIFTIPVPT